MYDLQLPKETLYNRVISKDIILMHTINSPLLKSIYDEQIKTVTWMNKLSAETFDIQSSGQFKEIEIFDIVLKTHSVDKRLLQRIDKSIPYYLFHILQNENKYQAWIADKHSYNGKIKVENYSRTLWLSDDEFRFSFSGKTIESIYGSLKEQVNTKRKHIIAQKQQVDECNAFMDYFRTMKMTRSYKPVLILAALQAGGTISVEQAADFFIKYYQCRKVQGLQTELGKCVYVDEPDNINAITYNLIHNPIEALCHSGFFEYDSETKMFYFSSEIYDGLTLDEIDEIGKLCNYRLSRYFGD